MGFSREKSREYLFVYGTLLRDIKQIERQALVQHAKFFGYGTMIGKLFNVGKYPGAVPSDSPADIVKGEVWELFDAGRAFKTLDDYEGCSGENPQSAEFRREKAKVAVDTGKTVDAWVYFYNLSTDKLERIGGDYLEYLKKRKPSKAAPVRHNVA